MLSIIIPTYHEAEVIAQTISGVLAATEKYEVEIIVVDGGSHDNTVAIAGQCGARVVKSEKKGRAAQMNKGASVARYGLLYFLHADSTPPHGFMTMIIGAIQRGATAGCFQLRFDYDHWFLRLNCWFTRFNVDAFHYGDQSLFVAKTDFVTAGGFSEDHVIFEDYQMIKKLKKQGRFVIMKQPVVTSARKYRQNGIFRMQGIFYLMYFLYKLGFSQQKLVGTYRRLITQDKI